MINAVKDSQIDGNKEHQASVNWLSCDLVKWFIGSIMKEAKEYKHQQAILPSHEEIHQPEA